MMMQPRDAHCDDVVSDCAVDEEVETLPVMTSSSSSNQHPASEVLVGARKRKALRVVKHQQQQSPVKPAETTDSSIVKQGGNISMDTGVSSDLSESRPSLLEEDEEEDEDLIMSDSEAGESGGEFYRPGRRRRRRRRQNSSDSSGGDDEAESTMRRARKQRRLNRSNSNDEEEDGGDCHPIHQQQHPDEEEEEMEEEEELKCPECGESFSGRAHLIHHTQRAHPGALKDHHLAAVTNNKFGGDVLLTNPPEEYKNEEDDPFSAVLREMKIKGEFPCRLCEAVFTNLRALKGHNRNHLTQAPYRCNMCPSTSNDKGALIRHMRTHNGERPYECRDCQYAFTTKANCERHLRNRHGKQNREAVRAAIVYHLSSDQHNKSSGSLSNDDPLSPSVKSSRNSLLDLSTERRDEDEDDLTDYPSEDETEQDGPLDLTVDVLDLRKRAASATAAVPLIPARPLVALPAEPQQQSNSKPAAASLYPHQPAFFGSPYSGPSIAGLPFFYPGLGSTASYSAFFESKLAEMGSGNPAVDLSALALAAAHHDALRQAQQQQQQVIPSSGGNSDGLLMPVSKKQQMDPSVQQHHHHSTPIKMEKKAAAAALEPGIKMVLKNGVLVKKQKQRRYRTERPFGCEHCTARFTLRSNMERHIKQQHPDIWSTRPRGHRRSACPLTGGSKTSSSSAGLPTMVELKSSIPPASVTPSSVVIPAVNHHLHMEPVTRAATISEQVRQAVQQKLSGGNNTTKRRRNSEQSEEDEEDEDEGGEEEEEEEEEDGALVIDEPKVDLPATGLISKSEQPTDLASVTKLINNAVAQSFQQYFPREDDVIGLAGKHHHQLQQGGGRSPSEAEGNSEEMDEGECTSISDGHSGSDFGSQQSDNNTQAVKSKKKSAYSNAPHRVSCPYCSRKFPWTSSLRRHILTHTGQKPYKCPQCPLWFTTKSNCDRHLLRKHGNHLANSHQQGGGGHGSGNSSSGALDNSSNVPDRPFKCARCPSSTFATSDNLKKHVDNKHCPGHGRPSSPESIQDDSNKALMSSSSSPEGGAGQQQTGNDHQLPFKCHLCEEYPAGFGDRQAILDHLKREHCDEFTELVSKGALLATAAEPVPPSSAHTSDDGGEDYESIRGKFPDYVNRKVMCAFCLRRFWSAEDLRRHMRTHSGERPFQCDVCSRKFTLKHSMLRHKRKHATGGQADDEDDSEEEEEGLLGGGSEDEEEEDNESSSTAPEVTNSNSKSSNSKVVRMEAFWKQNNKGGRGRGGGPPSASDLISNLLGIKDTSIVEQLMSKPADDAARLLGVTGNRV